MSQQLQNFFKAVQSMPHWANQHSSGRTRIDSHEVALANELITAGYTEEIQTTYGLNSKGKKKKILKYQKLKKDALLRAVNKTGTVRQQHIQSLVPTMSPGTFIRQPAGSQSFPDFLICDFSGTFVVIEAKSGRGAEPVWNDSLPREDAIYIMSSGKHNSSTFWLGQDWLAPAEYAIFDQLYKDINLLVNNANQQLKLSNTFKRGFQFYSRKKHQQGGGKVYTDPFTHTDRSRCENNVLTFALNQ